MSRKKKRNKGRDSGLESRGSGLGTRDSGGRAREKELGRERSPWQTTGWVVVGLAILVFVCYWNSLHGDFQFDDTRLIRFNFSLRDLTQWQQIFLSERYRPLLAWTFALNFQLGGRNTFSYHVFNVLFHAIAVILFYFVILRQTPRREIAITGAALMAVHSLNTESVSYIASRSIVLCSIFFFSALLFFDSFLRSGKKRFAAGYFLCFFLGVSVKEEAAMIPIVAALYQWLLRDEETPMRKNWWVHLLGGIIVAAGGIFRVVMQLKQGTPYPWSIWIPTEVVVWMRYLRLTIFPAPLNVDPDIPETYFSSFSFLLSAAVVMLIVWAGWRIRKAHPFATFWIFWYLLNLIPSSAFPLLDFMAEHRSYLSTFGFLAVASYFLCTYGLPKVQPRWFMTAIIGILVAVLALATFERNKVWATEITLWADSVQKSPQKTRPYLNLGAGYMKHLDYDLAIKQFEAARAISPNASQVYSGLGVCYLYGKKDLPTAEKNFKKALELQPYLVDAKTGLGSVYFYEKRYEEALPLLEQIYPQRQESAEVITMLAGCYLRLKKYDQCIEMLKRGIQLAPDNNIWYFPLMQAYFFSGNYDEAGRAYDQYSTRFANVGNSRLIVAEMLVGIGRTLEGIHLLQELASDPDPSMAAAAKERLAALKK